MSAIVVLSSSEPESVPFQVHHQERDQSNPVSRHNNNNNTIINSTTNESDPRNSETNENTIVTPSEISSFPSPPPSKPRNYSLDPTLYRRVSYTPKDLQLVNLIRPKSAIVQSTSTSASASASASTSAPTSSSVVQTRSNQSSASSSSSSSNQRRSPYRPRPFLLRAQLPTPPPPLMTTSSRRSIGIPLTPNNPNPNNSAPIDYNDKDHSSSTARRSSSHSIASSNAHPPTLTSASSFSSLSPSNASLVSVSLPRSRPDSSSSTSSSSALSPIPNSSSDAHQSLTPATSTPQPDPRLQPTRNQAQTLIAETPNMCESTDPLSRSRTTDSVSDLTVHMAQTSGSQSREQLTGQSESSQFRLLCRTDCRDPSATSPVSLAPRQPQSEILSSSPKIAQEHASVKNTKVLKQSLNNAPARTNSNQGASTSLVINRGNTETETRKSNEVQTSTRITEKIQYDQIAFPEPALGFTSAHVKRVVSYENTRTYSRPNKSTSSVSLRRLSVEPTASRPLDLPRPAQVPGNVKAADGFDDEVARQADAIRKERLSRRVENVQEPAATSTVVNQNNPELVSQTISQSGATESSKHAKGKRRVSGHASDGHSGALIGNLIGEDHANYVLMYNMLTGIRIGVSRCQAKLKRPLTDADYTARHKFSFDIVGNELTPSAKYDFKFKDYAPWVFRELREHFLLDPADYLLSLTAKYILSELGSPGKSGSFFYFSRDYRFIIKTIHHSEHKFLRTILKDYHTHVKSNPHTLISRFYGLHRVKLPRGPKIHFVIMNNLFPPHRDIHETFDLKGSAIGREYPEDKAKSGAVLKDLNWIHRGGAIDLGPMKKGLFEEQLKRDTVLLQHLGIMDYSLLIGLHDMSRGNRDRLRDDQLKVFQPVTDGVTRRPTRIKREQELAASALRKAVQQSDPQSFNDLNRLPLKDRSERKHFIFYQDEGGFQATDSEDQPLPMIYYLGIIDILTPYSVVKKIEHFWKGMSSDKHMISAVPPDEYGDRFLDFLLSIIRGGDVSRRPRME